MDSCDQLPTTLTAAIECIERLKQELYSTTMAKSLLISRVAELEAELWAATKYASK